MHISMFRKAYRKLKSNIYYDNSTLFLKRQLAEFEYEGSNKSLVEEKLETLCKRYNRNPKDLFDELLSGIDVVCYPKRFSESGNNSDINLKIISNISLETDRYSVGQLSYFISLPIEAHILGVLWILTGGRLLESTLYEHAFGNRLREPIDESLEIETNTPYLFKPYFKLYESWRDKALDYAKKSLEQGDDVFIISLDLQSYYYTTDIKFKEIKFELAKLAKLKNIKTEIIQHVEKLTDFINMVFIAYSKLFSFSDSGDRVITPIGFLPSNIIVNWYLREFDEEIIHELKPLYYGRYVDDMLFVIDANSYRKDLINYKDINVDSIINDLFTIKGFSKKNIFKIDNENTEIAFRNPKYKFLTMQKKKTKLFYLNKEGSKAILDNFTDEIRKNSSEFRLLHEEELLNKTFENAVYKIKYEDTINKFRGIADVEVNKYEMSKYLAKVLFIYQYIDRSDLEETSANILTAFKEKSGITLYSQWDKVFTYYLMSNQLENISSMFKTIKNSIDMLFVNNSKVGYKLSNINENMLLKKTMIERLIIALAMAFSLRWDEETKYCFRTILLDLSIEENILLTSSGKDIQNNSVTIESLLDIIDLKYIKEFISVRHNILMSNMMKQHYIISPLKNYCECRSKKSAIDYLSFKGYCEEKCDEDDCFDNMENQYVPRFIHLHEIMLYHMLKDTYNGQDVSNFNNYRIFSMYDYIKFNYPSKHKNLSSLSKFLDSSSFFQVFDGEEIKKEFGIIKDYSGYDVNGIIVGKGNIDNVRVAVGSVKVTKKDIEDTIKGKRQILKPKWQEIARVINVAATNQVKILVLPECYLPLKFIRMIAEQSRKHQMLIIVGIEHVLNIKSNARKIYNYIATFLPGEVGGYKYVIPKLRLKNCYAPSEEKIIRGHGFEPQEGEGFDIFRWNGINIVPFYCFEIADIKARGIFRSKVDIVTVSEWNKDVNYFSNIIEALSRDLHCYCVQSNTSQYGDSRIVQPSKTETKDIYKIKGGQNAFIIYDDIDIKKLRDFQVLDYRLQEEKKHLFKQTPPKFDTAEVRKRNGDS